MGKRSTQRESPRTPNRRSPVTPGKGQGKERGRPSPAQGATVPEGSPGGRGEGGAARRLSGVVRDIARVAAVMFDGELCREIVTDRSWLWMANFDPKDRWSAMDNYDVEHGPFVTAKQTLLRLERLAPAGARLQCLLWVPVATLPGKVTVIIWNGGPSRWWKWGGNHLDATPEMQAAVKTGRLQEVPEAGTGVVTILAPVRDSLKEVTGFIEVSASTKAAAINW